MIAKNVIKPVLVKKEKRRNGFFTFLFASFVVFACLRSSAAFFLGATGNNAGEIVYSSNKYRLVTSKDQRLPIGILIHLAPSKTCDIKRAALIQHSMNTNITNSPIKAKEICIRALHLRIIKSSSPEKKQSSLRKL